MNRIYRVGSVHGTVYCGTKKEVRTTKLGGEEPDSIEAVDAAHECNWLLDDIEAKEKEILQLRRIVAGLISESGGCPSCESSEAYREAFAYMKLHPLPPATASDRDGGRSYGV